MTMNDLASAALVQRITGTILVACTAFVSYEYFLTFEQEVRYVWLAPWTAGKCIFLLGRYLFFVDIPVLMWVFVTTVPTDDTCTRTLDWVVAVELPALIVAWLVVGLRTWAIWNRNIICGAIVSLALLAATGIGLYDAIIFIGGLTATTWPTAEISGCLVVASSMVLQSTVKLYFASAGYESIVLFATLLRGVYHLRRERSSLTATLYRDAFFASTILFTASVLVAYNSYSQKAHWISYAAVHRTLTAVIPTRILLNLRKEAYSVDGWDVTIETTHLETTHSIFNVPESIELSRQTQS